MRESTLAENQKHLHLSHCAWQAQWQDDYENNKPQQF